MDFEYLQNEDGIIVLGAKPHSYNYDGYYISQYSEIKAIQN